MTISDVPKITVAVNITVRLMPRSSEFRCQGKRYLRNNLGEQNSSTYLASGNFETLDESLSPK